MHSIAPIAITIGDTAGVGAEIIYSWAIENPSLRKYACVVGHKSFLDTLPNDIGKVQVGADSYVAKAGCPDIAGARIAFDALEESAKGCIQGRYSAVLTAPISKACMKQVGFNYQGHTEFFADRWGGTPVMSFAGEKFIVSFDSKPLRNLVKDYDKKEESISSLVQFKCAQCRASFMKGVFLAVGTVNDPFKSLHAEFLFYDEERAEKLDAFLAEFGVPARKVITP